MNWQAVFFDFDGVILDSVNIKTEAFEEMFRPYGSEVASEVVQYHLANCGVSRYRKFAYYYTELLKKPVTEEELQRLGLEFSDLVLGKILQAPFIQGAPEALEEIRREKIPAYLVTGTPEEEMNYILKERGLNRYFAEVHGAPKIKTNIVRDILERKSYRPARCLYLGDALTDYEAAAANEVQFLGIVTNLKSAFPDGVRTSGVVRLRLDGDIR